MEKLSNYEPKYSFYTIAEYYGSIEIFFAHLRELKFKIEYPYKFSFGDYWFNVYKDGVQIIEATGNNTGGRAKVNSFIWIFEYLIENKIIDLAFNSGVITKTFKENKQQQQITETLKKASENLSGDANYVIPFGGGIKPDIFE